ncbi:hypothetical protein [Wolbachia endosymbiont of Pentidionis agamae]|uniref:hypothetical protein n=1 Tax=Wolbachia endosymbiont of Pentidionis agamae TaxID=3110435 RepID=UPI002FD6F7C1
MSSSNKLTITSLPKKYKVAAALILFFLLVKISTLLVVLLTILATVVIVKSINKLLSEKSSDEQEKSVPSEQNKSEFRNNVENIDGDLAEKRVAYGVVCVLSLICLLVSSSIIIYLGFIQVALAALAFVTAIYIYDSNKQNLNKNEEALEKEYIEVLEYHLYGLIDALTNSPEPQRYMMKKIDEAADQIIDCGVKTVGFLVEKVEELSKPKCVEQSNAM